VRVPAPSSRARPGRPPRISRADIVDAARRIVDREGVQNLTMRRVAAEVGGAPMALYHHVRGREQLLTLLLDDVARELVAPDLPAEPRERIVAAATAVHALFAHHPWVAEALTADDLLSPAALWFPETVVDAAIAYGATPEDAVHAYRTIWYYTAGEIIIRAAAARRRADDTAPTLRDQVFAELDPRQLPRLAALGPRWAELTARDTYARGLRALVEGLLPER
jgi:AcrR family transcriptional regulator